MSLRTVGIAASFALLSACAQTSRITFPQPDQLFVTSGDGDIQKPYTPIGEIIHYKTGWRLGLPLLGLIPIADVDPDAELRKEIFTKVREMGGDALINMRTSWTPASGGWLGLGAKGGYIVVTGTVIRR
jgi:hypothetical protein